MNLTKTKTATEIYSRSSAWIRSVITLRNDFLSTFWIFILLGVPHTEVGRGRKIDENHTI